MAHSLGALLSHALFTRAAGASRLLTAIVGTGRTGDGPSYGTSMAHWTDAPNRPFSPASSTPWLQASDKLVSPVPHRRLVAHQRHDTRGRSSSTGVVDVVVEVILSGPRQSVAEPRITPVTQSP
jgi:hypothetical protein